MGKRFPQEATSSIVWHKSILTLGGEPKTHTVGAHLKSLQLNINIKFFPLFYTTKPNFTAIGIWNTIRLIKCAIEIQVNNLKVYPSAIRLKFGSFQSFRVSKRWTHWTSFSSNPYTFTPSFKQRHFKVTREQTNIKIKAAKRKRNPNREKGKNRNKRKERNLGSCDGENGVSSVLVRW